MATQVDLRIDVTNEVSLGEPAHVAASIVLPDPDCLPERPLVCFAKPGGGYSTGYYTCELPGPGQAAQASWHVARGWIFVAIDNLGSGSSSSHDPDCLDFAVMTEAAHAAEQDILLRMANGVLLDGYPPVHQPTIIGIGQSMGASLVIYQQSRRRGYDGLGILGFSAVHSHPVTPPGEPPIVVSWFPRGSDRDEVEEPLNAAVMEAAMASGPEGSEWKSLAWGFHYDDVPYEVVEQDLVHYDAIARGEGLPDGIEPAPWNSYATPGKAARSTLTPGVVATEAAAITVPVLSIMGVRDLVPDPYGEARAFRSSRSVDLFICPRMGHMHNFAGTRELFWERIHSFGNWCAAVKAAG
ncbi:MAG: alpha/beta hydrolase [Novosphingobium sp.]|nr:alpha/beta hydrolase [Novosphingobium sp.]